MRRRHPGRRSAGRPRGPAPEAPSGAVPSGPDRDHLYAGPRDPVTGFAFDERVAAVFPDMIRRSVPGYETILSMIGMLAGRYAQPGSRCYDLGCSLGAAALAMRGAVAVEGCRIVAVDNAPAMIKACRDSLAPHPGSVPVDLVCADVRDLRVRDASVAVLNFTLQFLPAEARASLLEGIARGLRPGGILILSEKIRFDDPGVGALFADLHAEFKRSQGYSELEIARKRAALENVLVPETLQTHRARLLSAGFQSVEVWFQCLSFVSLVAFR